MGKWTYAGDTRLGECKGIINIDVNGIAQPSDQVVYSNSLIGTTIVKET